MRVHRRRKRAGGKLLHATGNSARRSVVGRKGGVGGRLQREKTDVHL